ncbi:MarR family winged helix-turn-helix transcriptional regulator [Streptoalloteichus hindustanus]|uniref:DNA-binding transcriptional regulator, MarR family n=1 Tax=Streptoalloteichus hindustanus TaxID=2017 RepID=A0A1M5EPT8_STRHI|nr:MarR family transcriptional regulator [Streptoalloteichus hindustanus]SHF81121.1 DNA-binding transcriptional regulator, MarR family [Streptoalloteichus hindustanus]
MGDQEEINAAVAWRPGNAIKRAEQALIAEKTRALRPFGLTVPQYAAMYALSLAPGISGAKLARFCAVTPQTMTTVLRTLESRELVERRPSPDHAQVLVTRLTPTGQALLERADAAAVAVERRLVAAYTPEEAALLRELLDRAVDVLTNIDQQN